MKFQGRNPEAIGPMHGVEAIKGDDGGEFFDRGERSGIKRGERRVWKA